MYFLTQYHRNAPYTMTKHAMFLEYIRNIRARQHMNQIVKITVQCVHQSVDSNHSLSHQWSIDLSMICWSRFSQQDAHSHYEIVQAGNRSANIPAVLQSSSLNIRIQIKNKLTRSKLIVFLTCDNQFCLFERCWKLIYAQGGIRFLLDRTVKPKDVISCAIK